MFWQLKLFIDQLTLTKNQPIMMRYLTIVLFIGFITNISYSQTPKDTTAIKSTALNYIEGWYTGNAERMSKAVHPKLAKRIVGQNPKNGNWIVSNQDASTLIKYTKKGAGTRVPKNNRRKNVEILDIFQGAASVKIRAASWVDYLHMAKWKGEWKIINVLWEKD